MSGTLPAYPDNLGDPNTWRSADALEQYAKFDQLLSAAETPVNGDLPLMEALPDSPEASENMPFNRRGQVIAERLWLLGYLEAADKKEARAAFKDNRGAVLDAVELFQKEMKLKVDRWPGVLTWNALHNLVSFECDDLDKEWLKAPEKFRAILRAAQCRLFVLGLSSRRPGKDFQGVELEALRKFLLIAMALGAIETPESEIRAFLRNARPNEKYLSLLLDQDRLIAAAAKANKVKNGKRFFSYRPIFESWSHKQEVRAFLIRLTQIEFWLMGYEINLLRKYSYPLHGFDRSGEISRSKELKKCLEDFAKLSGKSKNKWNKKLTPGFFIALHEAAEAEEDESSREELENRLTDQAQLENALQKGRKLHLRIWDGVKRVLRWIGRLFRKAVDSILDLAQNIARFFFNCVQRAFDVVKKAVKVIVKAFATLDGSVLKNEEKTAFVKVSIDGDVVVGYSTRADLKSGDRLVAFLRLDAERFCLAARLCALILSALLNSAFAKWASLAKTLFSNLRVCLRIMGRIYKLEREMAMLEKN